MPGRMIDLYTWTTPNGRKVSILFEECGLPYTVHPVNIRAGEQFKPEFVAICPNSKIPAIVDREAGFSLFESGAILIHLAEKTGRFLPARNPGAPRIAGRQEPPRLLGEVDEDGARLEEREAGLAVDDRRDLAVRADGDELGLELLALADVDGVNGVGQAALLEHDGDLPAVRRRPGVEVDHAPGMVAPTSYVNPLASGGRAAYQGPHA